MLENCLSSRRCVVVLFKYQMVPSSACEEFLGKGRAQAPGSAVLIENMILGRPNRIKPTDKVLIQTEELPLQGAGTVSVGRATWSSREIWGVFQLLRQIQYQSSEYMSWQSAGRRRRSISVAGAALGGDGVSLAWLSRAADVDRSRRLLYVFPAATYSTWKERVPLKVSPSACTDVVSHAPMPFVKTLMVLLDSLGRCRTSAANGG